MVKDEAEGAGGRPPEVPDEVLLETVKDLPGTPETEEVRSEVEKKTGWGGSRAQVGRRLDKIAAKGEVVKKDTGPGKANSWMMPEKFKREYPDDVFVDAIRNAEQQPPTTEEVAEEAGFNKTAVLKRLQKLEREGRVSSRKQDSTLWVVRD
jgi:predicted Rossmann fold nucleotide-binding protein DprA/Smf involved in DNA uptake